MCEISLRDGHMINYNIYCTANLCLCVRFLTLLPGDRQANNSKQQQQLKHHHNDNPRDLSRNVNDIILCYININEGARNRAAFDDHRFQILKFKIQMAIMMTSRPGGLFRVIHTAFQGLLFIHHQVQA